MATKVEVTERYVHIPVRPAGDFVQESFRMKVLSREKGIQARFGKLKKDPDGAMVLQAYLFAREKGWTLQRAQDWIDEHKKEVNLMSVKEISDSWWSAFASDLKDDPMNDLVSIHRRFHMWAAQGAVPEGMGKSDLAKAHNLVVAELKRRWKEDHPDEAYEHDSPLSAGDIKKDLLVPDTPDEWLKCGAWNKLMGKLRALLERSRKKDIAIATETEDYFTIGGYGLVWGGKDLVGQYFTPETDFWFEKTGIKEPMVLYTHGADGTVGREVVGRVVKKEEDSVGLWIEAQIEKANQYAEYLRRLVKEAPTGFSSGAVQHLVAWDEDGMITDWPIVEFSTTVSPAEPRTLGVTELRSLVEFEPAVKSLLPEGARGAPAQGAEGADPAGGEPGASHIHIHTYGKETQNMGAITIDEGKWQEMLEGLASMKSMADVAEAWKSSLEVIEEQQKQLNALVSAQKGLYAQGGLDMVDGDPTKTFADWIVAVAKKDMARLGEYGTKLLDSSEGGASGFLVPPAFLPKLLSAAEEESIVRRRTTPIPLEAGTDALEVPVLDQTTVPTGGTAFLGGVVAHWTKSGTAKTETEPEFRMTKWTPHELAGYTKVTNKTLRVSPISVQALLYSLFGRAIAWHEDDAFLNGTGTGQPLGVLKAPCLHTEPRATANDFQLDDAAMMLSKFLPSSFGRGVWVLNVTVLPKLVQMKDAASNVVWIPNAREGLPMSLFGMPVVFSEKTPVLGSEGDVLLADFNYYLIVDGLRVAIDSSEHYAFTSNQTVFRFAEETDGQPWLSAKLPLQDGSNYVSPFVALTDAS